jgi:hypothetical protein
MTKSKIAASLSALAAAGLGVTWAVPQAVKARIATSRRRPCRPSGGLPMLTAVMAAAIRNSGAADTGE